MIEAVCYAWLLQQMAILQIELLLMRHGYRRRRAIYGSVLFAQDEWVKA